MNTLNVQNSSGASGSSAGTSNSNSTASGLDNPLTNKQTFITLLVAQLKNQDPLNPVDGVQFLSQLTQISSVEQLMDIRQDADILAKSATAPTGTQAGSDSSGSRTNKS